MNSLSYTFTLWHNFQNLLRTRQIQNENAAIEKQQNENNAASLMCLPDDILLLIFDQLHKNLCPNHKHLCDNLQHFYHWDYTNFSMSNHRLRNLSSSTLFRNIHLGRSWSVNHTISSLSLLSTCDSALYHVRELTIDLWVGAEQTVPAKNLPQLGHLLSHAISKMENLSKLSFSTTKICGEPMKEAFLESDLLYPQIREVRLGCNTDWFIQLCPGLNTITSDDWFCDPRHDSRGSEFISAAGRAGPGVRNFGFHCKWDAELLQEVWVAMPQLQSLSLDGGQYLTDLSSLLVLLKKFKNLRKLRISGHERLRIIERTRYRGREDITAYQEAVVKAVFREVPRLEEVAIGKSFRAWVVERRHGGRMELKWEAEVPSEHIRSMWMEDICTLGEVDDELDAMLSDVDDTRSTFSRTDTLAM